MSYVQLSEGGFQVVYPLGLWSRSSGVVKFKSYMDMASTLFTFTFTWPYAWWNSVLVASCCWSRDTRDLSWEA